MAVFGRTFNGAVSPFSPTLCFDRENISNAQETVLSLFQTSCINTIIITNKANDALSWARCWHFFCMHEA